ncbi:hypothetical protein HK101_000721 [Irineochytrium annulatum]|nr:hypothetical protein HK101_000721 [Irineochytrium annulatum]
MLFNRLSTFVFGATLLVSAQAVPVAQVLATSLVAPQASSAPEASPLTPGEVPLNHEEERQAAPTAPELTPIAPEATPTSPEANTHDANPDAAPEATPVNTHDPQEAEAEDGVDAAGQKQPIIKKQQPVIVKKQPQQKKCHKEGDKIRIHDKDRDRIRGDSDFGEGFGSDGFGVNSPRAMNGMWRPHSYDVFADPLLQPVDGRARSDVPHESAVVEVDEDENWEDARDGDEDEESDLDSDDEMDDEEGDYDEDHDLDFDPEEDEQVFDYDMFPRPYLPRRPVPRSVVSDDAGSGNRSRSDAVTDDGDENWTDEEHDSGSGDGDSADYDSDTETSRRAVALSRAFGHTWEPMPMPWPTAMRLDPNTDGVLGDHDNLEDEDVMMDGDMDDDDGIRDERSWNEEDEDDLAVWSEDEPMAQEEHGRAAKTALEEHTIAAAERIVERRSGAKARRNWMVAAAVKELVKAGKREEALGGRLPDHPMWFIGWKPPAERTKKRKVQGKAPKLDRETVLGALKEAKSLKMGQWQSSWATPDLYRSPTSIKISALATPDAHFMATGPGLPLQWAHSPSTSTHFQCANGLALGARTSVEILHPFIESTSLDAPPERRNVLFQRPLTCYRHAIVEGGANLLADVMHAHVRAAVGGHGVAVSPDVFSTTAVFAEEDRRFSRLAAKWMLPIDPIAFEVRHGYMAVGNHGALAVYCVMESEAPRCILAVSVRSEMFNSCQVTKREVVKGEDVVHEFSLVVARNKGFVDVYRLSTHAKPEKAPIAGHHPQHVEPVVLEASKGTYNPANDARISPDGLYLASVGDNGNVSLGRIRYYSKWEPGSVVNNAGVANEALDEEGEDEDTSLPIRRFDKLEKITSLFEDKNEYSHRREFRAERITFQYLSWSCNSKMFAVTSDNNPLVLVFDVKDGGRLLFKIDAGAPTFAVAFHPAIDTLLAFANRTDFVQIVDLVTVLEQTDTSTPSEVCRTVQPPRQLLRHAYKLMLPTVRHMSSRDISCGICGIQWADDGRHLYIATHRRVVMWPCLKVVPVLQEECLRAMEGGNGGVQERGRVSLELSWCDLLGYIGVTTRQKRERTTAPAAMLTKGFSSTLRIVLDGPSSAAGGGSDRIELPDVAVSGHVSGRQSSPTPPTSVTASASSGASYKSSQLSTSAPSSPMLRSWGSSSSLSILNSLHNRSESPSVRPAPPTPPMVVITGRVILTLPKHLSHAQELSITLTGKLSVYVASVMHWVNPDVGGVQPVNRNLIERTLVLWTRAPGDPVDLAAGEHEWSFALPVPAYLPPSVELNHGKVEYTLKARMARRSALLSDIVSPAPPLKVVRTRPRLAGGKAGQSSMSGNVGSPYASPPSSLNSITVPPAYPLLGFKEVVLKDPNSFYRVKVVMPEVVFMGDPSVRIILEVGALSRDNIGCIAGVKVFFKEKRSYSCGIAGQNTMFKEESPLGKGVKHRIDDRVSEQQRITTMSNLQLHAEMNFPLATQVNPIPTPTRLNVTVPIASDVNATFAHPDLRVSHRLVIRLDMNMNVWGADPHILFDIPVIVVAPASKVRRGSFMDTHLPSPMKSDDGLAYSVRSKSPHPAEMPALISMLGGGGGRGGSYTFNASEVAAVDRPLPPPPPLSVMQQLVPAKVDLRQLQRMVVAATAGYTADHAFRNDDRFEDVIGVDRGRSPAVAAERLPTAAQGLVPSSVVDEIRASLKTEGDLREFRRQLKEEAERVALKRIGTKRGRSATGGSASGGIGSATGVLDMMIASAEEAIEEPTTRWDVPVPSLTSKSMMMASGGSTPEPQVAPLTPPAEEDAGDIAIAPAAEPSRDTLKRNPSRTQQIFSKSTFPLTLKPPTPTNVTATTTLPTTASTAPVNPVAANLQMTLHPPAANHFTAASPASPATSATLLMMRGGGGSNGPRRSTDSNRPHTALGFHHQPQASHSSSILSTVTHKASDFLRGRQGKVHSPTRAPLDPQQQVPPQLMAGAALAPGGGGVVRIPSPRPSFEFRLPTSSSSSVAGTPMTRGGSSSGGFAAAGRVPNPLLPPSPRSPSAPGRRSVESGRGRKSSDGQGGRKSLENQGRKSFESGRKSLEGRRSAEGRRPHMDEIVPPMPTFTKGWGWKKKEVEAVAPAAEEEVVRKEVEVKAASITPDVDVDEEEEPEGEWNLVDGVYEFTD